MERQCALIWKLSTDVPENFASNVYSPAPNHEMARCREIGPTWLSIKKFGRDVNFWTFRPSQIARFALKS
jgi:hypothetical protein